MIIPSMGKETGSSSPPSWMQELPSFTTAKVCNHSHHSVAIKIMIKFRMTLKKKQKTPKPTPGSLIKQASNSLFVRHMQTQELLVSKCIVALPGTAGDVLVERGNDFSNLYITEIGKFTPQVGVWLSRAELTCLFRWCVVLLQHMEIFS